MPRKILILNWRDINNPSSGGAEVLTHEMAKRWVKSGNSVTQFSSFFGGGLREETIDGVKIVRRGNPDARHLIYSVHFRAFLYYLKHLNKFDVVIDEIHGLPFFTPLYIGKKKVALICEVAGKIWDANFPFPFNEIGKVIEKNYFRLYRHVLFLTISSSTQKDLVDFGVPRKNIVVLPMGITVPLNLPSFNKEKVPTVIFVGRLLKAKGIEDAIRVCARLKKDFPNIRMWIVGRGDGEYEKKLKDMVKTAHLLENVTFFGFLSQRKKFEMLQKAHILVVPSLKEGFGLTVPEAGIVGTPSVAYNVEGLKDIITDMKNGILVDVTPDDMAIQVKRLLLDLGLYRKLQKGASDYAKGLSWDKTANRSLSLLEKSSI